MAKTKTITKPVETNEEIIDISLPQVNKRKFRINGDNSKILQLNVSDLNFVFRFDEGYNKLKELSVRVSEKLGSVEDDADEETIKLMKTMLKEIDGEMRAIVDEIFDSNVSEVCAPFGTMYDPVDGMYRFEHIITTLTKLYDTNINSEVDKIKQRVSKHTSKYIK